MPLKSRAFRRAKDPERPQEYEDAYAVDPVRGIAVVADGVSSAIFSARWARILAEATVADPPDPDAQEAFALWLAQRRRSWSAEIDTRGLAWFQRAKLPLGAFSTLLWVRVTAIDDPPPGQFGAHRLQSRAIGDSCLFHVRNGELVRLFPIGRACEFEVDPLVLGSVDLRRDELMQFGKLDEVCYPDDLLVLCTDAVAEWALRQIEAGRSPAWEDYWSCSATEWHEEIDSLRRQRHMRYDDATLVLLRVVEHESQAEHWDCTSLAPQAAGGGKPASKEPAAATQEQPQAEKAHAAGSPSAGATNAASGGIRKGWREWSKKALEKYHQTFRRGRS